MMQEQRITMQGGNTLLARRLLEAAAIIDCVLLIVFLCVSVTPDSGAWPILLLLVMLVILGGTGWYALTQGLWFEWRKERVFRNVCAYLGYTSVRRDRPVVAIFKPGIIGIRRNARTVYPQLRLVHGSDDSWVGQVKPFTGQTVKDYQENAERFATAFRVNFVKFEPDTETGLLRITAGRSSVPHV
jgi:hypothetical protein